MESAGRCGAYFLNTKDSTAILKLEANVLFTGLPDSNKRVTTINAFTVTPTSSSSVRTSAFSWRLSITGDAGTPEFVGMTVTCSIPSLAQSRSAFIGEIPTASIRLAAVEVVGLPERAESLPIVCTAELVFYGGSVTRDSAAVASIPGIAFSLVLFSFRY
eukprot:tig00020539_g10416.t1